MKFIDPDYLILLIFPLLCIPFLAAVGNRKRKQTVSQLLGSNTAAGSLRLSYGRRFWRHLLLTLAVLFLITAAARPTLYSRLLPFAPKGRDLLVLCDVSRSMNAADIAPSRLKHAQFLLRQLSTKERGDRFGLAVFAGNAYLSCPLTADPVTFNEYVDELSTDSVPAGGTNLEKALNVALKAFAGSETGNRAVILLTDGEELQGNIKAVTAELKKKHIPVFAVGFGDPVNGSVIPAEPGSTALVRDKDNKIVTTRLNEKLLSELAARTGGAYIRTTVTDPGIVQLESAISGLDRRGRQHVKHRIPVEEFPKVLILAAAVLILFLLLSERKNSGKILLLLISSLLTVNAADAPVSPRPAPPVPPAGIAVPETTAEIYNLARKLQKEGKKEARDLYYKVISQSAPGTDLYSRSFHNLGADLHAQSRSTLSESRQKLRNQQLNEALTTVSSALKLTGSAAELYARSAGDLKTIPPELAPNLNRLARDRKEMEELKKKIEELLKQQQQARQQTQQAQEQNRSRPQNQQQRQQQQNAIDQARRSAEKLQQQARQMQQNKMADAAQKAADELNKAAEAKKNGQDQKSSGHIENARRELKGNEEKAPQNPSGKDPRGSKEQKDNPSPRGEKTSQTPTQAQAEEMKKAADRKGAEQLLELMGDDDKKLRSAVQKRSKMRRQQSEKDW